MSDVELLRAVAAARKLGAGQNDTLALIRSFPPRLTWLTNWMRSKGWGLQADYVTRLARPPIIGTSFHLWDLEKRGLVTSAEGPRSEYGTETCHWYLTAAGERFLQERERRSL